MEGSVLGCEYLHSALGPEGYEGMWLHCLGSRSPMQPSGGRAGRPVVVGLPYFEHGTPASASSRGFPALIFYPLAPVPTWFLLLA